ncbi:hypothetical protein BDV06DRAFT_188005 [Aspergillus oleicola]
MQMMRRFKQFFITFPSLALILACSVCPWDVPSSLPQSPTSFNIDQNRSTSRL